MLIFFIFFIYYCHAQQYFEIGSGLQMDSLCQESVLYLKNNSQIGYRCSNGQMIFDGCYPLREERLKVDEGNTWYDNKKAGTVYLCNRDEFIVRGCMSFGNVIRLGEMTDSSEDALQARRIWDPEVCKFKCALMPPDGDSLCKPHIVSTVPTTTVEGPPPIPEEPPTPDSILSSTTTIAITIPADLGPENMDVTPPTTTPLVVPPASTAGIVEPSSSVPGITTFLMTTTTNIKPPSKPRNGKAHGGMFDEPEEQQPFLDPNGPPAPIADQITPPSGATTAIPEVDPWIAPKKIENLKEKEFGTQMRRQCSKKYWARYNRSTKKFCTKVTEDKFEGCLMLAPVCRTSIIEAFSREAQFYPKYQKYIEIFTKVMEMNTIGIMSQVAPDFIIAMEYLSGVRLETANLYKTVQLIMSMYDTRFRNMTVEDSDPKCVGLINRCSNLDLNSCYDLQRAQECHGTQIVTNDCCMGCSDRIEFTRQLVEILCPETCMITRPAMSALASYQMGFQMQDIFTCPAV